MNNFTLKEIQLGLEVYEKLLLQEAYLKGDKQSLTEIKLSFKGIKDLGQKALAKFKSLNTAEKTFVGLLGKLKKETGKEAKEILDFIKSKAKEYKGKSFGDLKADIEKITADFVGEKLDEAFTFSPKMKQLGGALLLTIATFNILGNALSQEVVTQTDLNNNNIEVVDDFDSNKISDDTDTTDWVDAYDAASTSSTGGDISYSDVQDGVNAQGVKVNLGDIGGALSFDTGEFDASQTDIDKVAQDAVDNLVKNLDGKDLKKVSIDPFGFISNTPGDQDNNEVGPGNDKLGQLRANTAKKIADKVQDLLKDKYPDADISIGESTTNVNSVDSQKEVSKGSKEALSTQVAGVSFGDLETGGDTPDDAPAEKDIVKPDVAKARLIDPKLELEDKSRYRALLSLFLPLLIDDYEATMEKVSTSLQLEDSDFPVTRGKMEKKLAEIKAKENKDENDELAIKILEWSIGTSKSPSTLLNNINRLDPKVALGKRQLKKSLRPGQRGKNMGIAGTGKTQGNTGDQVTSPSTGNTTVGESVLLEAKTDFSELPNYNQGKAKSNLGILVPLYSAYWASEPGKTADGTTLPTGFDIDYVMSTYKDSWRKFEKDYPVIVGKVKFNDYIDYGTDKKSGSTTDKNNTPPESMDAKPDGVEKDAENLNKIIDQNTVAKTKLALINTKAELQLLLKNILMLTNQNFAKQDSSIKSYMMTISNQIKAVKEGNEDIDVKKVIDVLMLPSIKNKILMINNKDELKDLIVNVILPNVHPTLRKNLSAMKGAVIGAGNAYKYDASELDERDLSKSVEKIAQRLPDAEFKKRYGKNWKSVKIATAEKLAEMSEEKRDRCLKIADRKFDKPSAYKSGAVVRCRKGKIWKGIKEDTLTEKEIETLRTWFKRKGAPGKTGGWIDCNSPIRKDGKITGYKPCGRQKGEKRKYPACRPTPARCKDPGKGKTWGKTK